MTTGAGEKVNWGILGPGQIAGNFADGLVQSSLGRLAAVASRDEARLASFGARYALRPEALHGSYASLLSDPRVDAVYIATPHPFHADLAHQALAAGKAVLVEKPMGVSLAEVEALVADARARGVFLMEAYMYRCHPQIARMLEILASGEIGDIRHVSARFGFEAPYDPDSRLFSPSLAGGGILDVGGYPVSAVRLIAGAATGAEFAEPISFGAAGVPAPTGVDAVAYAVATFPAGVTAEIACAVCRSMTNILRIEGSRGYLTLDDPWIPGRDRGPSDARLRVGTEAGEREEWVRDPRQLFAHEIDVASRAILAGLTEAPWPALSLADSVGNAAFLEIWRSNVTSETEPEASIGARVVMSRSEDADSQ